MPEPVLLSAYQAPDFHIKTVTLNVQIDDKVVNIINTMEIERQQAGPLVLQGDGLTLEAVHYNGVEISYTATSEQLIVPDVDDVFTLTVHTQLFPQANTSYMGLYQSGEHLCTQCEAEGFRRITYFLDRPDVLSIYRCRITASKRHYPYLLSNGNPVDSGSESDGRHWVEWFDPFPKPCYLFALVAGNFDCVTDSFTTQSGRKIMLQLLVEEGKAMRAKHAMSSLKHAMHWDEQKYQREYDLDQYTIVAVSQFNMGAMENKGLNIFNDKFVLGDSETATDQDYEQIEAVVAHEYFHNWTGNRITCRDWFQLSLKEGLTVYRDQCFTADRTYPAVKRIRDVRLLQAHQFKEDAGPMAHAVRPEFYEQINNFYTVTVYEKGAELVRMLANLLGEPTFFAGMQYYFDQFDGQAVTIEDFIAALQTQTDLDLSNFLRWYQQPGTPTVDVEEIYNEGTLTLHFKQHCRSVPGYAPPKPLLIPLHLALLNRQGERYYETVFHLDAAEQTLEIPNQSSRPVVSMLRGYSAPIILQHACSDADLLLLLQYDDDDFNRWRAGQTLVLRLIQHTMAGHADDALFQAYNAVVASWEELPPRYWAELLTWPSLAELAEHFELIDVSALRDARYALQQQCATTHQAMWAQQYTTLANPSYVYCPDQVGRRSLRNTLLAWLALSEGPELALDQYAQADNMTDRLAAMRVIVNHGSEAQRENVLTDFYTTWQHDHLVLDKWFAIQAAMTSPEALAVVTTLLKHADYSLRQPNRVRALVGTFSQNWHAFYCEEGFALLAEQVLALDTLNPQVAARLVQPLCYWQRYASQEQAGLYAALQYIHAAPQLSRDVSELVNKSLACAD